MNKIIFGLLIVFILHGCSRGETSFDPATTGHSTASPVQFTIEFINDINKMCSEKGDTLYLDIRIMERGRKVFFRDLNKDNIIVHEEGFLSASPELYDVIDIRDRKIIDNALSILILVDRSASITQEALNKQKEAVRVFVREIPDNRVFLAFMDSTVSESRPVKEATFDNDFKGDWVVNTEADKLLYKSILSKIGELSGYKLYYPHVRHQSQLQDSLQKMLFIFTDGKIYDDKKGFLGGKEFIEWKQDMMHNIPSKIAAGEMHNIPIHCIYFGEEDGVEDIIDEMTALCSTGKRDEMKGKFHQMFNIDSLSMTLLGTLDSIAADYRLVLLNPAGKTYKGQELAMKVYLKDKNGREAFGVKNYSIANPIKPLIVPGEKILSSPLLKGILFGLLIILLVYGILQFLVPWIRYRYFCKKYVVPFKSNRASDLVQQQCYHCKESFCDGEQIVIKCKHSVHLECWEENRNRCPEYGVNNCKKGIHYYNQKRPGDPRNAVAVLSWILYGLTGGALSWILYQIVYSRILFTGFIKGLVETFYPMNNMDLSSQIIYNFQDKIQSWLLCGLILGMVLTFMFAFLLEFRRKSVKIILFIMLRAIVGGILGFLSFLIGSIIVILFGKAANYPLLDWIPWLLFASSIALVISFKTEIELKNALLGGAISVLLSFLILYLFPANVGQDILGMFSFMLYASGLGMAIAVVHFISEKYFLHISGSTKDRDIAIYKWMSVTGGYHKVTIGKSIDCIIEMNWDKSEDIADKQVEIYIENDLPYCRALTDGTFMSNGRELRKDQKIHLSHGTEFTIGKTKFTYIEKDK